MDTGFILHATERSRAGRTEIHYIGRLESGDTFAVIERRRVPGFFVRESDADQARSLLATGSVHVIPSDMRTMDGAALVRVEVSSGGVPRVRDILHQAGVRTYEADMKLSSLALMDRHVHGCVSIEGAWRAGRRVGRIYEDPTLHPCDFMPALTVLSVDIETDPRAEKVLAVALVLHDPRTANVREEVLFNGGGDAGGPAGVTSYPTERELLRGLRDRVVQLDPDIVTGWNVVDFDIRVLARRFASLGVPFDVGRSDVAASFLDRADNDGITRWRRSKAIVPGRQVLDAMWLVRMAGMGLEDYRLETVAQSVLGRGKRIDELPGESRTAAVMRLYRDDPTSLCAYCLEDTRLALEILRKEGLLEIAIHKSLLIGTQLEQTSTSVASFEHVYTESLHDRRIAAPTLGIDQDPVGASPGGGIITPRAGLFRNVLAFDFKSLYPSLMRTFNLDPLARIEAARDPTGDSIRAPNGVRFGRTPGILPGILDRFSASREEARKRGDKRAAYAYKIVMNSMYGVLGTPGCRFAASELAGAITTFGQHILYRARDLVIGMGHEVIYGDTDSLFVLAGESGGETVTELMRLGETIAAEINARLDAYARESFGVVSRLELEFEAIYRRFFLPPMRTAVDEDEDMEVRGRAKGYAGLPISLRPDGTEVEGPLDVKGIEAVRHDWTPMAQDLQRELLVMAFHDAGPKAIGDLVRNRIRELRAGRLDAALVYRRSLRRPVEEYTRSSPPHARAALLLPPEERTGLIRYVWTVEGPQPESRRTAPPDYEHYIQKQMRPVVESIAPYIPLTTDSLFAPGGQISLF